MAIVKAQGLRKRILRAKGILDGAETLEEARQKAEAFASYLATLETKGWKLNGQVLDDYAFLVKGYKDDRQDPE